VKRSAKRRVGERGASFFLVMVLGPALIGIVGLALDAGQLYVTKRRAQAAADAAAQAGVMDLYREYGWAAASASAIAYGQKNGFTASEVDPQHPNCKDLAWCDGHVTLSGVDSPNLIQVTVTKVVNTIFLRALGVSLSTVKAVGTAAISVEPQPVPILVLHPTASGSFSTNGGNTIRVCGGPPRSIQVNSSDSTSVVVAGGGTVDLSRAGPLDPGDCSIDAGADFANVSSETPYPGALLPSPSRYIPSASLIEDPLIGVVAPAQPAVNGSQSYVCAQSVAGIPKCPVASHNCPGGLPSDATCVIYSPGYYAAGIQINSKTFAQFRPGIYWINHGGFQLAQNSIARMATGVDNTDPSTGTGWKSQMLVYNSPSIPVDKNKDILNVSANSGQINNLAFPDAPNQCPNGGNCLVGSPTGSSYKGILVFQNRATATTLSHALQGGSGWNVKGTVYLTHTAASIKADSTYQSLSLQGGACSSTVLQGEIIVDKLSVGGNGCITMNLTSAAVFPVRQVALVQ